MLVLSQSSLAVCVAPCTQRGLKQPEKRHGGLTHALLPKLRQLVGHLLEVAPRFCPASGSARSGACSQITHLEQALLEMEPAPGRASPKWLLSSTLAPPSQRAARPTPSWSNSSRGRGGTRFAAGARRARSAGSGHSHARTATLPWLMGLLMPESLETGVTPHLDS
jgi:hypothetical protein